MPSTAAPNARASRTNSKDKKEPNANRKRSGSALGKVSKRVKGFEPESPSLTDDALIPTYDASLKKLEAFRHSDSSSYTDHQDIFPAYPKARVNNQPAVIPSAKGPEQKESLADDPEPWLLDSDPFEFVDLGNNGNGTGFENQQSGVGKTEWNSLSSETSYLRPNHKTTIAETLPKNRSSSERDPFSDLEDADFAALDSPAQQVLPHWPKPSTRLPNPPLPRLAPSRRPIVRLPFPEPVQARSLVHGISAATVLRTCFRVGEALRAGSRAVHDADDVVIELFARVASSVRKGTGGQEAASSSSLPSSSSAALSSPPVTSGRQDFTFMDLFHDRPPHLKGVYDLWKGSELWEAESREFLGARSEPVLCRCVGKMKRYGKGLLLTVFSVRRVSWGDVDHAKVIVCGP
jgi:hypothetical protein